MDLEAIHKHLITLCAPTQLPAPAELQSSFDELTGTLNQLIELEEAFTLSASESERLQLLNELCQNVTASGGFIDGVGFTSFLDEGLGLRAETNIKAGQLLMKIPRTTMLTHEDALACPAWSRNGLSADPMCARMPNACLALYLLHHRCLGPASPHWAYVRCLPAANPTVCLSFDSHAYRRLAVCQVARERVLAELRNAVRQYLYFARLLSRLPAAACAALPLAATGRFTYAAYRWAVSAVMSRNNAVPASGPGGGTTLALIPLWDMGNHHFGQVSTDYSPEDRCLLFYAMEDACSGSQVYFMYGVRSSADYLLYSGFAPGHGENPHDTADLRLGLNPRDKLIEEKTRCLAALGMERSHAFHLPVSSPLTQEVLAFGRVMCAQTAEEVAAAAAGLVLDRRAGEFLANRCRLLSLGQLATATAPSAGDDAVAESAAAAACARFADAERLKFAQLAGAFDKWAAASPAD